MSVLDHLRELRRRLVIVAVIIVAGAVAGWVFYDPILHFLEEPYCSVPYTKRFPGNDPDPDHCNLIYTGVLDGFTTRLKVAVIAGAVLTGPLWLYQLWAFVTPGLKKNERKYTVVFILASTVLFLAGMTLAFLVLSKGLNVLINAAGSNTIAVLTANGYLSFVTLLLVVFGAAFELPLLVIMANLAGVLSAKLLRKSQRISIFLIFLFAAVATPMVILFEGAVVFATIHDRRKAKRVYAAPAEDWLPSEIDPIPKPLRPATEPPADPAAGAPWGEMT
jgi:sec-independent protein translocase protein TatC